MAPSNLNIRGYSCPHEELEDSLLIQIASAHARETVRRFIQYFSERLRQHGEGIIELFDNSLDENEIEDFATVWDPAYGYCYAAMLNPNCLDVTNVAATLALRLGARGHRGEWHLVLEDPTVRLRWDRWLLPLAERITVNSDGHSAAIQCHRGASSVLVRLARTDVGWAGEGADQLPTFGTRSNPITLLTKAALSPRDYYQLPAEVDDRVDQGFLKACQSVIGIMTEYAHPYLTWVERTVRYIVVLKQQGDKGQKYSGSSSGDCGLIHACVTHDPIRMAEILVHEAAHQYYYLLCRLGAVDDGTDQRLYFSPLVRTNRPLHRILLAYHAVANIILFARMLRTNGAPQTATFSQQQENVLLEELSLLEKPLRNNPALTAIGRAIVDPLIANVYRGL